MKFTSTLYLGVVVAILGGCSPAPQSVSAQHPLLGKWTWTTNNCPETYEWRADGTYHAQSGAESVDGRFKVTDAPDAAGFYAFTEEVTKDFGGKDCTDSEEDSTGQTNTVYIQLNPAQDQIMACYAASLDNCIGPLTRVRE